MVRLKHSVIEYIRLLGEFQFHYGSIKAPHENVMLNGQNRFQFHYGSIKAKFRSFIIWLVSLISIPLWFD